MPVNGVNLGVTLKPVFCRHLLCRDSSRAGMSL